MPLVTVKTQPVYGLPLGLSRPAYQKLILSTQGLALYWRLNEASGTTAKDLKGANNGTYGNSPTLGQASPLVGDTSAAGVLFTKGSQQSVTTSSYTLPGHNWTMMCWLKAGALPETSGLVMHAGSTGSGFGFGVGGSGDGSGSGLFWLNSGIGWADLSYTFANTTDWHHMAFSATSDTITYYVDSVSKGTLSASTAPPAGVQIAGEAATTRNLTGTVAEASFFSTGLTAAQIAVLYRVATKGV